MSVPSAEDRYVVMLREGYEEEQIQTSSDLATMIQWAEGYSSRTGNTFWIYDRASGDVVHVAEGDVGPEYRPSDDDPLPGKRI